MNDDRRTMGLHTLEFIFFHVDTCPLKTKCCFLSLKKPPKGLVSSPIFHLSYFEDETIMHTLPNAFDTLDMLKKTIVTSSTHPPPFNPPNPLIKRFTYLMIDR